MLSFAGLRLRMLDASLVVVFTLAAGCGNGGHDGAAPLATDNGAPWTVDSRKISQTTGGFSAALADFDNFGTAVAGLGDLDGDGVGDLAVGAPWHEDADRHLAMGAVWILFMNRDLSVRTQVRIATGEAGFDIEVDDGGRFGAALASVGDVNKDGVPDLVVGAPQTKGDFPGIASGTAYTLLLRADGTVKSAQEIRPGAFGDAHAWDRMASFGSSVAPVGDVDGDHVPDVAITGVELGGPVSIVLLERSGTPKSVVTIESPLGDTRCLVGPAGDLDRNGVEDLVVVPAGGGPFAMLLKHDGTMKSLDNIHGPYPSENDPYRYALEETVASVGDLDGDGVTEVALLSQFYLDTVSTKTRPMIFLYYFDRDRTFRELRRLRSDAALAQARKIAGVGDLNGDGRPELAACVPWDDDGGPQRGAFWLLSLRNPAATTTTSTTNTTSTSSTTTSTCPADLCTTAGTSLWDVSFYLEASRPVSALSLRVDYGRAPGSFLGTDGDPECNPDPDLHATMAFNDLRTRGS